MTVLSERKFYQKITDLYATDFDYDKDAKTTRKFFQTVPNKVHWANRLDGFLEFNGNELLIGAGKVSAEQAKLHADTEFEKYRIVQDKIFISDYDKYLLKFEEESKK